MVETIFGKQPSEKCPRYCIRSENEKLNYLWKQHLKTRSFSQTTMYSHHNLESLVSVRRLDILVHCLAVGSCQARRHCVINDYRPNSSPSYSRRRQAVPRNRDIGVQHLVLIYRRRQPYPTGLPTSPPRRAVHGESQFYSANHPYSVPLDFYTIISINCVTNGGSTVRQIQNIPVQCKASWFDVHISWTVHWIPRVEKCTQFRLICRHRWK